MTIKRIVDVREFRARDQLLLPWSPGRSISVAKAAELLGCGHTMILEMIESGELKAYKLRPDRKNSPWRIYKDSLELHMGKVRDRYELNEPR